MGRWVAAAALVALALVTSGCGGSAPEITDEQVAGWKQLAERNVPSAQNITVEAQDTGSDMFGNYSTYVAVNADFATSADLAASEHALADLAGTVVAVVGGKRLKFEAHYEGADADAVAVGRTVPPGLSGLGVAKWYVGDEPYKYDASSQTLRSGWFMRIYADDPNRVTPAWLADVTEGASKRLSEFHATVGFIQILPGSAVDIKPGSDAFSASEIDVRDLESFKKYGIKHNCVRTDAWVFDVQDGYLYAYPVATPGGSCA